jgi:K+:H+ antiporter
MAVKTVPPIAPDALLAFLIGLVVLLLLAHALGRTAERFGLPAVVGELLTGVLVGPSLLGHLAPGMAQALLPVQPDRMHLIDAVGQLGVLLLVGVTGTYVDLGVLRRQSRTAATVSLFGLLIPLAAGIGLGLVLRAPAGRAGTERWVFALFLGVAMAVTALPVIAKTLTDMRLLHRTVGQLTLAAGTIDDAVGWFLLSVVGAAATLGVTADRVAFSVAALVGFVLVAVTVGRPLVRAVMRLAARAPGPGPTVATAVLVVLAGAAGTHALGMEPVFGAFVAGLLVGAPGAADKARLAPLRTVVLAVLAPIFLASAGLRVDLTALGDRRVALSAAAVLAVAIGGKFVGAYLGARLSRLSRWEGLALGAGMNARGVVEVIVAMTGLRLGVLDVASYTTIVLVAIVTSLMAPPVLRFAMARVAHNEEERLRELEYRSWGADDDKSTVDPVERRRQR